MDNPEKCDVSRMWPLRSPPASSEAGFSLGFVTIFLNIYLIKFLD